MWTIEPYKTDQLPSRISNTRHGQKTSYTLRMKFETSVPCILEYYYADVATDKEEIAFQGLGNTEQDAIDDMASKLKAVGLRW